MSLIKPQIKDGVLHISAPGMPDHQIPLSGLREHTTDNIKQVRVWSSHCQAVDEVSKGTSKACCLSRSDSLSLLSLSLLGRRYRCLVHKVFG